MRVSARTRVLQWRLYTLRQFLQLRAAPLRAAPHRLALRLQGLVMLRRHVVGRDPDGKMSEKVACERESVTQEKLMFRKQERR